MIAFPELAIAVLAAAIVGLLLSALAVSRMKRGNQIHVERGKPAEMPSTIRPDW